METIRWFLRLKIVLSKSYSYAIMIHHKPQHCLEVEPVELVLKQILKPLDSKAVWISSRSQMIGMSMMIREMSVVPLIIASFIDFDFSFHWAIQVFSSECCSLDSECKWSTWIFVWVEGIILFFIIFNGVRMMFYRPEGSLWTKYYTIADGPSV